MAGNLKTKRSAPLSQVEFIHVRMAQKFILNPQASSKKRKLNNGTTQKNASGKPSYKTKDVKKDKAADRGTIPIPSTNDDDVDVSDQDLAVLAEFGGAVNFLNKLDRNGIMRYSFFIFDLYDAPFFLKVFFIGARKKRIDYTNSQNPSAKQQFAMTCLLFTRTTKILGTQISTTMIWTLWMMRALWGTCPTPLTTPMKKCRMKPVLGYNPPL